MRNSKKRPHLSPHQFRALGRIAAAQNRYVCGIDEVGRGCFAGPITVGGVVFPKDFDHDDIDDSKRLSHKRRVKVLHEVIFPNALATVVLSMTPEYVDRLGVGVAQEYLTEGVALYMRERFKNCVVVQDGDLPVEVNGSTSNVVWLPKADQLVPSVAAASIIAKVSRDTYMKAMAKHYPGYGFESNVGYHSAEHMRGLRQYGACALHRKSWKPVKPFC